MTRNIWTAALALGAVVAASNVASADDVRSLAPASGTTMTLGGKGTAEQAATEDTELARGYRGYGGYYGGYRGGYGYGWGGYRGGYYGGYRGYYGGGYYGGFGGYYRPAYYYAPRYYPSYYGGYYGGYYPAYSSFYYSSPSFGFSIGIGGSTVAASAPVVPLGGIVPNPMTAPTVPGDGTFRYDGGPAAPVPLPKADPQPIPPAGTLTPADLPISLRPKAANSPYKYKAYGEK